MKTRVSFSIEKKPTTLLGFLPEIQALADSEKEALNFWPEQALREAIVRRRLVAMIADVGGELAVAGYLHHSGLFPHAKIQQVSVVTKYRKFGVASALLNDLVSELECAGFMTIKAEVASDLPAALAFYEKNRFEIVRTRAGGRTRNRKIVVRERQLDTDSLFKMGAATTGDIDLGIRRRNASDAPFYTFDLNVLFDLVKNRGRHDVACRLFGAALAHQIRLVVAPEFVTELERTTLGKQSDPVLQMALRLPRLPASDRTALEGLAERIHHLVFVEPNARGAGTVQARSDSRHLAHSVLSRASGFITSDGVILAARNELLSTVGLDIANLDELIALLPPEPTARGSSSIQGDGFECKSLASGALRTYMEEVGVAAQLISEFASEGSFRGQVRRDAISEGDRVVGAAAIMIPSGMDPTARLMVHVDPGHVDREIFSDYLLDSLTRFACSELPVTIELAYIAGQSTPFSLAKARGFLRMETAKDLVKIALGRPLTLERWPEAAHQIRRRTGFSLPSDVKSVNSSHGKIAVTNRAGVTFNTTPGRLEDVLSPTVIIWPGREGVVVPITRAYANDLLGTSNQLALSFIKSRDAAFLSRRAYVNSPRTTNLIRPESPILFYESIRSGGRGAVIAVARILDSVIVRKAEVPGDGLRRLVVADVKEFSASDDVLLTTFDNLLPLPRPVSLGRLKKMDAIGKANLVTAVPLSSDKIAGILDDGWS